MTSMRLSLCAAMGLLIAVGCGEPDTVVPPELETAPGFRKKVFFLEAPCEVNVEGVGMVDVEAEYIPGVVACENGSAPPEALKAQAVQARSFLYYKLFVAGATTIRNSQADQVYSCSYRPNGPGPEHIAAAEATKGQYLEWENSIVAAFYVAGAIPPNPDPNDPINSCRGNGGSDPTSTQRWVTYNWGKSGCDIDMTNLGFVPADCRGNPHNRGCASQNGQTCLSNVGVGYQDQIKYFYGDDIVIAVGEGRCGGNPPVDPNDQFCIDNGDGSHCLDAATRIDCAAGAATTTETCDLGCGDGACLQEIETTFCTGQPDGAYCDGAARVECVEGAVSLTEACPDGCFEGACEEGSDPTNNGTGGGNNVIGGTNGVGSGGNDDDGSGSAGGADTDDSGLPPIIGTSPGVEGGCSTAAAAHPTLALLVAPMLLRGRKKRRRA